MTKQLKIVSIIGIIIFAIIITAWRKEVNSLKNAHSLIQDSLQHEIKYWKDKDGHSHTSTKVIRVDVKNKDVVFKKQADKLNVKPKDINSETDVTLHHDTTLIVKTDTLYIGKNKVLIKEYKDKWNLIQLKGDSLFISIKDKWTLTSYMKRPHWYSLSKIEYRDVETENTLIKVVDVKDWQTKKTKPIIIIAPYIGTGYNPFKNIFYPSIGICAIYYPLSYKIY